MLHKSSYFRPYNDKGGTNLKNLSKKAGVYIIRQGREIVYIGYSGVNLYKTITRHFQDWSASKQKRAVYKPMDESLSIRVIVTTPTRAEKLERLLIIKYKPRDCTFKYNSYVPKKSDDLMMEDWERAPVYKFNPNEEPPF